LAEEFLFLQKYFNDISLEEFLRNSLNLISYNKNSDQ